MQSKKLLSMIFALVLLLSACNKEVGITLEDLPEGDPARGEALFTEVINGSPSCITCHSVGSERGGGPGLLGYGERAGGIVAGESAEEYSFNSIVLPAKHIAQGYSNAMYRQYAEKLSLQEIADLIAYMLSL